MEEDGDCRRMVGAEIPDESEFHVMLLEPRPFRPFKSSEEYLYAMKEDLAEWLNSLYGLQLTADDFMEQMETGVILCRHANKVMHKAREYYSDEQNSLIIPIPDRDVVYRSDVLPGTFHARDNISNFISWCRALAIKECLLFETDDLVLRKNERSFILCLLEVARRGAKFGMPAPLLVQMEQEIDAELANDDGYETVHAPPQIVTNDLLSLHERVVQLLSRCTCPSQFPMIRVADGKYRIGDTKVLIFVRILRSHVMVRVGGGWDTLEHYLDKHDPCRCRSGHRLATSAKLTMQPGKNCSPNMHVTYNRPPQAPSSTPTSPQVWRRCIAVPSILDRRSSNPDIEVNHPVGDYSRITQFSDDSSASNTSLHLRDESPENQPRAPFPYADSSSEASDGECCNQWNIPQRKMRMLRPKDTVPSSWKYTPSVEVRGQQRAPLTTSPVLPRRRERESLPNIWPREGRIPPPSTKSKIRAPQITRLNSDNSRTKWTDQRSQSSEDLYQNKPPVQKPLVFHSRGSSPVNVKNRTLSGTGQYITPPQRITPIKNKERGNAFQRADPIRNSNRSRKSPDVSPKRAYVPRQRNQQPTITHDSYPFNRIGSVQDRSTVLITDHHGNRSQVKSTTFPEKALSPLLEKLLQDTDLGSDEKILKRMEMLINEYKMKMGRKQQQQPDDRLGHKANVLSVDSSEGLVSDPVTRYRSRSPNAPNIKSPSKIPVPKSYRKC